MEKKIEESLMPEFILEVINTLIKNNPDAGTAISSMFGTLINELNNDRSNIVSTLTEAIEQLDLVNNEETRKLIQAAIKKQEPQTNITLGEAKQRLHNDLIQSVFQNSYNNQLIDTKTSTCSIQIGEAFQQTKVVNNKTAPYDVKNAILKRDVLLLETPTTLSLFRYIKENLAFNNNQNKLLPYYIQDLVKKLSESSYTPDYDKPICQTIQSIINGRILLENDQLFYQDEQANKHPIQNVATGIKSLGMLQLLLAGGAIAKDTVLIIDEPEVHLHPSWQLEYAQIIVELVKEGILVLITSHSSYLIQALDIYTTNAGIAQQANFYLGEMTPKGSVFDEVTDNLEAIYKAFAAPSLQLMLERSRGKRAVQQPPKQWRQTKRVSMVQEEKAPYKKKKK
jgi:hypothetical protein